MATSPSKFASNEFAIKRLTPPELAQFVRRYCDDEIVTIDDALVAGGEAAARDMFVPLALGALSAWSGAALEQIGTIYEVIENAGPRTLNGRPVFYSMKLLHADDWMKASELIDAELARRDEAERAVADATESEDA